MNTEELERVCREAEESGKDVSVTWHPEYNVIDYIEIDGVEIHNDHYADEVDDAYWLEDSYRVAERATY